MLGMIIPKVAIFNTVWRKEKLSRERKMKICFNGLGKMYHRGSRGVIAEVEKAD